MTASKDMSRPTSQHRLSVGANSGSLPRNPYARTHSHSTSYGSVSGNNRISRRKSSTFSPAANAAALGAAVESGVADGSIAINRRTSMSKAALSVLNDGSCPPVPSSLPQHVSAPEGNTSGSAVDDGPSLSSYTNASKQKVRRASEATGLTKKEKTATGDLKCDQCGKAYKHGSCLTKHLWEHTPQWQYTSKLLISKHQQVQLLEAASVLVAMNQDAATNDSDNSSSPAASGSSDMRDEELSSAETTPPPQADTSYRDSKRFSSTSSAYSRSYQSVFSESVPDNDHGHHRHWSTSSNNLPFTANSSIAESYREEDPQDLAAAVGLLSCSYGTPKTGPTTLGADVPPVPPLPAKYATSKYTTFRAHDDVDMHDNEPSDEVDEGVFGKMD